MDNITQRLNERLSERPDPSEAQKSAGNYKKGMVYINGMRVSIENPAGSIRKGKDQDGNEWESELKHHYGYIRGTTGRDKDHIDAFLASGGSVGSSDRVHVIDQVDPKTGRFDEHKIVFGAKDQDHAADTYLANYPDDWDGFGAVTEMPLKAFKQWAFQDGRRVKALSSEVHDNHVKAKSMPKFAEGGSVLGALKDSQFWKDVMSNAGDLTQAASNSVAGNVAGPVDMINWALKKAGAGSQKPVLGSDWLKDKGLMRDVAQSPASLAGETLGLLAPTALMAGAPKIAGALNKGMENIAAPRTLNPQTGAIVWHGSPHEIVGNKFDSSKIGTGEGAQAYGHGHYTAGSKEVAQTYQPRDPKLEQNIMKKYSEAEKRQDYAAMQVYEDYLLHKTPVDVEKSLAEAGYEGADLARAKAANEYAKKQYFNQKAGSLYKIDLPDEHIAKMLDWDKPLSQQAPEVQKALSGIGYKYDASQAGAHDDALLAALSGADAAIPKMPQNPMGSEIAKGAGIFDRPQDKVIAEKLRDAGIPGIRYLDGASRADGVGSSNFVVFPGNEHMLNILERNGQPVQKFATGGTVPALDEATLAAAKANKGGTHAANGNGVIYGDSTRVNPDTGEVTEGQQYYYESLGAPGGNVYDPDGKFSHFETNKKDNNAAMFLAAMSGGIGLPAMIGAGLGLSGAAAGIAGGAITGGGIAGLTGNDIGKGALMGGIGGGMQSITPDAFGLGTDTIGKAVTGAAKGALSSVVTGGNPLVGLVSGATGAGLQDVTGNPIITQLGTKIAAGIASGKTPDQVINGLLQNPGALLKALSNGQNKPSAAA